MAESSDDIFLRDWVKKQLDSGDEPGLLKTVLKNRGMNPGVVDSVLSSINNCSQDKKTSPVPAKPKKEIMNDRLKKEVDGIIFSSKAIEDDSAESPGGKEPDAEEIKDAPKDKAPEFKKEIMEEEKHPKKAEPLEQVKTAVQPKQAQQSQEKSIFSLFLDRVQDFVSGIKISSPKITEYFFDTRIVVLAGIAVAILILALLISFGLDWYADWAAQKVLS